VIEDEFEQLKNAFFEKYCDVFEDTEENKLVYMDIFKEYIKQLESYIDNVRMIINRTYKNV
jgi:ADP-ribosylation factor 2-binding protein